MSPKVDLDFNLKYSSSVFLRNKLYLEYTLIVNTLLSGVYRPDEINCTIWGCRYICCFIYFIFKQNTCGILTYLDLTNFMNKVTLIINFLNILFLDSDLNLFLNLLLKKTGRRKGNRKIKWIDLLIFNYFVKSLSFHGLFFFFCHLSCFLI